MLDDHHAVVFFSLGAAIDFVQRGILSIDGVPASISELRLGRYPLARTLNLVTKRVPTGAALAFVQYILSPAQRGVIEESDFVPYQ